MEFGVILGYMRPDFSKQTPNKTNKQKAERKLMCPGDTYFLPLHIFIPMNLPCMWMYVFVCV